MLLFSVMMCSMQLIFAARWHKPRFPTLLLLLFPNPALGHCLSYALSRYVQMLCREEAFFGIEKKPG